MTMTPVDRSPARLGGVAAIVFALVAWLSVGIYSLPALLVGAGGVALLAVGATRGTHWAVTGGAVALFFGTLLAGVFGAPAVALLLSAVTAVTAWDAGGTAIDLGAQLGREAPARRIQAVHIGSTALVGLVVTAVGYGVYRTATGGKPVAALVFLLVAALLLTEALS